MSAPTEVRPCDTREHRIWANMKTRCRNPRSDRYARYGGRGITVSPEWASSFSAFLADMGECPPGYTLERIDNDGNYEPSNCRWATTDEQRRNRSDNRLLGFRGESMIAEDWAIRTGIPSVRIRARIDNLGWSVERALTEPIDRTKIRKDFR